MDKKVLRERMRKKQQQMRRRRMMRLGAYVLVAVLAVIFLVKGIIIPIANRISGKTTESPVQVQAETTQTDPNAAIRRPLKSQSDLAKASQLTSGWHEDENGKWYQNTDGTYYAGGMIEIDGVTYSFDDNGYMQTGWVEKNSQDYYFNEDGSYDSTKHKPMVCLTFDDGPGQYTDELLDCLEQNNAHATFFMVGQNIAGYESTVQRMVELGCEIGNHTWDHPEQTLVNMDLDSVAEEFSKTDEALMQACGQAATVARAPYGSSNDSVIETVQKPFFTWSTDTEDWKLLDADLDYKAVMEDPYFGDGSIVLMHDIHEPSVKAAERLIPDLIAQGYKLVTVSEMAAAKNVTLQNASYSDFWPSSLEKGIVAGYNGTTASSDESSSSGDSSDESSDSSSDESSSDSSDYSDGSSDSSSDSSDESSSDGSDYSDGSSDSSSDSSDESSSDSGDYSDETSSDSSDYSDESSDSTDEVYYDESLYSSDEGSDGSSE